MKLSFCQMVRRLVETFRLPVLAHFPGFGELYKALIQISCQSVLASMQDDVDDTWNMEIFDELLETLSSLCMPLSVWC